MGFKVTWKLIYIGLYGLYEIPVLLTREEVFDYLDGLLTNMNSQTDDVVSLICERDDSIGFDKLFEKMVKNDKSDILLQVRKWRAYLLKILIDNIGQDCLQGLLNLMEFWMSMGKPEDCPHIFPDNERDDKGRDYFTPSTFNFLVKKNRDWLHQEIAEIIKLESE